MQQFVLNPSSNLGKAVFSMVKRLSSEPPGRVGQHFEVQTRRLTRRRLCRSGCAATARPRNSGRGVCLAKSAKAAKEKRFPALLVPLRGLRETFLSAFEMAFEQSAGCEGNILEIFSLKICAQGGRNDKLQLRNGQDLVVRVGHPRQRGRVDGTGRHRSSHRRRGADLGDL